MPHQQADKPGPLEYVSTRALLEEVERRCDSMVCIYYREGAARDEGADVNLHFGGSEKPNRVRLFEALHLLARAQAVVNIHLQNEVL